MDPFEALEKEYPAVIEQMGESFNAHQFILKLAHQYQGLYIQALHRYADHKTPFMVVHSKLVQSLSKFDHLVVQAGRKTSKDIFGQSETASVWEKRT